MPKGLSSTFAVLLGCVALSATSFAEPLHYPLARDPTLKGKARFAPVEVELQEGLNHLSYF